jgi:hypothetical protein
MGCDLVMRRPTSNHQWLRRKLPPAFDRRGLGKTLIQLPGVALKNANDEIMVTTKIPLGVGG